MEDEGISFGKEIGAGSYGVVVEAFKGKKTFVAKFFGYSDKVPDNNWILREVDNLFHLRGVDGVAQIECTMNDTARGLLSICKNFKSIYPVILMEKLSGGELFERIKMNLDTKQMYSERVASKIFRSFMSTLQVIHDDRNMINMDLKTENLVFRDEDTYDIKIIDFGMAVNLRDRREYFGPNGELLGSELFLAPETIAHFNEKGQGLYTRATDMWQAACILYILLVAKLPFEFRHCIPSFREPLTSLGLSPSAANLLEGMFQPDPGRRMTASQVLQHRWLCHNEEVSNAGFGEGFRRDFLELARRRKFKVDLKDKHNHVSGVRSRVFDIIKEEDARLKRSPMSLMSPTNELVQHRPLAPGASFTAASSISPRSLTADHSPHSPQVIPPSVAALGKDEINVIKQIFKDAAAAACLSDSAPSPSQAASQAPTEPSPSQAASQAPTESAAATDICLQVLHFGGISIEDFCSKVRASRCPSLQILDNDRLCRELDWDRDGHINYFECLFSLPLGYDLFRGPSEDYHNQLYFEIFDIDNSRSGCISLAVIQKGIGIYLQYDDQEVDRITTGHRFTEYVSKEDFTQFIIECRSREASRCHSSV